MTPGRFTSVRRSDLSTAIYGSHERDRKQVLMQVFGDVGWECPQVLAAMSNVLDIYLDRVRQIRMGCWTKGRIALVGDAAACVSLKAGEGTWLAMAEAYVLPAALHACRGDHGRRAHAIRTQ